MNGLSRNEKIAVGTALAIVVLFLLLSGSFSSLFNMSAPTQSASTTDTSANSASATDTGNQSLTVQDTLIGTGTEAKAGNLVTVNYIGTLTDGTKFDSSFDHGQPFQFTLGTGQVIPGWDQGIVGMKVGGIRHLVIPPSLAYGARGVPPAIPPNATLVFDVELLKVQ
jgi:FKBP-type peptidyl-prolyl cis-trans isomerase FkpA